MKIVQSFWNPNKKGLLQNGGFLCPEIHWMAWAFSCLQLRKFYPEVELHTDLENSEIFKILELPYTFIRSSMETDFMRHLHPQMWAYAKIHTYSIQDEPFLHVDGDVFIWESFSDELLKSELIAQNIEDNLPYYRNSIEIIEQNATYIPDWVTRNKNHPKAYNAGILGGSNLNFIRDYTHLAMDYYQKNKQVYDKIISLDKNANIVPEQYLFYDLSQEKNIPVSLLSTQDIRLEENYGQFFQLEKIPNQSKYSHLLGHYKKTPIVNDFVSYILRLEYPDYWHRIISLFKQQGILSSYMNRHLNILDKKSYKIPPQIKAYEDSYQETIRLSELFNIVLDEKTMNDNLILKDAYELESKILLFEKKEYNHLQWDQIPFPTYGDNNNILKRKDIDDYYVFVTPYHLHLNTHYQFKNLTTEQNEKEIQNSIYPFKQDILVYLDLVHYNTYSFHFDDAMMFLLETLKHQPTTIGELIKENTFEPLIKILSLWYSAGLVYFTKLKTDFIKQNPSELFLSSQKNIKNHVFSCLDFVLNHYQIKDYEHNILTQYSNINHKVSLYEIIQVSEKLGFQSKAVKKNISELQYMPFPSISILKIRKQTTLYVVITDVDNSHVTIFNPEIMILEKYPISYFSSIWEGVLILLLPKE